MPTIALVGNPNVGKSTLFNALTGARQRTMNAPGTTVSWEVGRWRAQDTFIQLMDLPGTQSLVAHSPDEQVTADALTGVLDHHPDLVIVLADATAIARSLYLLAQVADTGSAVILALTMNDVATTRGIAVDPGALGTVLGIPVVEIDPRMRRGLASLGKTVAASLPNPPHLRIDADQPTGRLRGHEFTQRLRDRADSHFDWVAQVDAAIAGERSVRETWSDRLDRVLLNPWLGVPAFLAVMWLIFQLTTTVAAPLQDWLDIAINDGLGSVVSGALGLVGLGGTWVDSFLVGGVVAGMATVATFIPPMGIMFGALALLEDSGYIARAGFVMDRLMRFVGLDGRAFLPLVIGFGCNLPALAATRTLPNARQRLLTGLLIPFSSCSARLTVFVVMSMVFFPANPGTAVFALYLASVVLIVSVGFVLRHTALRDVRPEPFVLAMPAYQVPRVIPIMTSVAVRLKDFVVRAGRVITATLVMMWLLLAIPLSSTGSFAHVPIEDSVYGRGSAAIAPLFTPAGYGDWHASSALVTGFFAKEVVVGALAQSYAVDEPTDPAAPGDLGSRLHATFEESSGGAPSAAAAAFMVFVLAYTPCAATVAEQRRYFGWRVALLAVGGSLLLAWLLSVGVFQVGRLL